MIYLKFRSLFTITNPIKFTIKNDQFKNYTKYSLNSNIILLFNVKIVKQEFTRNSGPDFPLPVH